MDRNKIVKTFIDGKNILFFCEYPDDHIQQYHFNGQFYESLELELIKSFVPKHSRILEIGANVGNHIVYYSMFLEPQSITWIEPNQIAYSILNKNIQLNILDDFVKIIGYPGYAFSDTSGHASISFYPKNIGGAKIDLEKNDGIKVVRGDSLLRDESYDFIKLDTESQDIEALRGIEGLVQRTLPLIFVEILDSRLNDFKNVLKDWDYKIVLSIKRYKLNTNYIIQANKKGVS